MTGDGHRDHGSPHLTRGPVRASVFDDVTAWAAFRDWTPDAPTAAELAELAGAARELSRASQAAGRVSDPHPPVRAAVRAVAARLEMAGLPAGLADAAVTGWYLMNEHWTVPEAVTHMVELYAAR